MAFEALRALRAANQAYQAELKSVSPDALKAANHNKEFSRRKHKQQATRLANLFGKPEEVAAHLAAGHIKRGRRILAKAHKKEAMFLQVSSSEARDNSLFKLEAKHWNQAQHHERAAANLSIRTRLRG